MIELNALPVISAPLPWQSDAWSQCLQQLEQGRFPHALLISGAPGIGKSRFALALARLLLCHRPNAGHNCGECPACEHSRQGTHGDFRWVQAEGDSRVIKVDQIRDAINFAQWTAGFGQRKVLVLAPADDMNINSANALLKSLEEPAANTHMILVCQRLHGVPATVRSRCQLLKLPLPEAALSLDWLDQVTGDRQSSSALLKIAEQRPLQAEQLYREAGADGALQQEDALTALVEHRMSVAEVHKVLGEVPPPELLIVLLSFVERWIKNMDAASLAASGRSAFALLDSLRLQQVAVAGGSNPNRQLFTESLLIRLRRELGPAQSNAKMPRNRRAMTK